MRWSSEVIINDSTHTSWLSPNSEKGAWSRWRRTLSVGYGTPDPSSALLPLSWSPSDSAPPMLSPVANRTASQKACLTGGRIRRSSMWLRAEEEVPMWCNSTRLFFPYWIIRVVFDMAGEQWNDPGMKMSPPYFCMTPAVQIVNCWNPIKVHFHLAGCNMVLNVYSIRTTLPQNNTQSKKWKVRSVDL